MYRPRSVIALNSWAADSTVAAAGYRHSPGPQEQKPDAYSGAKSSDVPLYKLVKGRMLYAYHRLTSCASCERPGETALSAALLLFTLLLWVLHAHLTHKVSSLCNSYIPHVLSSPYQTIHRCILVHLLLVLCCCGLPCVRQAAQPRYVVILDGGSTGTRVHVFKYSMHARSSYPVFKVPEPKLKVEPGLSTYASNAAAAGTSLQPLLKFAQQHVPVPQQASTPIYLMATAGMRLVPVVAADRILQQCRAQLLSSTFMFQPDWASIISGTSEGLYGWVAANYAAGSLQVSS